SDEFLNGLAYDWLRIINRLSSYEASRQYEPLFKEMFLECDAGKKTYFKITPSKDSFWRSVFPFLKRL
ncbi:MAG: hypothetical protein ACI9BD_000984, partial [Candidatus Marinamargulisbacteria bacterium]